MATAFWSQSSCTGPPAGGMSIETIWLDGLYVQLAGAAWAGAAAMPAASPARPPLSCRFMGFALSWGGLVATSPTFSRRGFFHCDGDHRDLPGPTPRVQ